MIQVLTLLLTLVFAQTPEELIGDGPVGRFVHHVGDDVAAVLPAEVQQAISEMSEAIFYQSPFSARAIDCLQMRARASGHTEEALWAIKMLIRFGVFGSQRGGPEDALIGQLVRPTAEVSRIIPLLRDYLSRPDTLFGAMPEKTRAIQLAFYQAFAPRLLQLANSRSAGRVATVMESLAREPYLRESLLQLKSDHPQTWDALNRAVNIEADVLRHVESKWSVLGLPPKAARDSRSLLTKLSRTARNLGLRKRVASDDCEASFDDPTSIE